MAVALRTAASRTATISVALSHYENALRAARSLWLASTEVGTKEFGIFARTLDLESRYPGLQAINWREAVPHAEAAGFVADARADGEPEFTIRPPGRRPVYYVTEYSYPRGLVGSQLGLDARAVPSILAPVAEDHWASVASAADDLAEVLDRRGTGRVGLAGWPAGGRVALALAARRPDLVDRVAVVSTPAPDEQVPWIPPEHKALLDALADQPPAVANAQLTEIFSEFVPADPSAPEALDLLGAGPADEAALAADGARDRIAGMLGAAFAQGGAGLGPDIAGYCLRPWGFEPAAVAARTLLLYGSEDVAVGPAHGRWWQQGLPDACLEVVPGAGHLVVIPMWDRVLSHLAPRR